MLQQVSSELHMGFLSGYHIQDCKCLPFQERLIQDVAQDTRLGKVLAQSPAKIFVALGLLLDGYRTFVAQHGLFNPTEWTHS